MPKETSPFDATLVYEEGFVGADCHDCAWRPKGYADRHQAKAHVAETGHRVTLRKSTHTTWGPKAKPAEAASTGHAR